MRRYLRNRDGRVFFFTLVTNERRPILASDLGRRSLRQAMRRVRTDHPFLIVAIVLLPDHIHAVLELPKDDCDYSKRWRLIKSYFSRNWKAGGGYEGRISNSRQRKGEQGLWQRRFYEHTCRDEADLKRCVDYCHVNPLKHGLVAKVVDWRWSSFHRYLRSGEYNRDWGNANEWYGDEFRYAE